MKYNVKGSIWIETPQGAFIGYGRAILLSEIKKQGSITLAAKEMKMSYRQAWQMIDSMNKQSKSALVKKLTGGAGGGGTTLTESGEKALACFWELHKEFEKFNLQATKNLKL